MVRPLAYLALILPAVVLSFAQSHDTSAAFEIADVRPSPKAPNAFFRASPVRAERYELKNATMVDLIRTAWSFSSDRILDGPNWLEMDRFDITAKVPADTPPDSQKPMLQSLLQDRFKLVLHQDTRPIPTYALSAGKKVLLKEADGAGETGCRLPAAPGPPTDGRSRVFLSVNGELTALDLGPGTTIQYHCRNMTMDAFAAGLRTMMGVSVGQEPVLNQTGLKGQWNFDVKWSLQMSGPMMADTGDRISLADALEKQLGLKLEQKEIPTPVLVVDSVNRKPADNPPGTAEALPPRLFATEFEVVDIKPTDPQFRMGRFQIQPGGRLIAQGMPLRFLINRAFNTFNNEAVAGLPAWADSARFDITAKAPQLGPGDMDALSPMMLALLKERFGLKYHAEDRLVNAYSLVAAKPKMKKADPASRAFCKNGEAAFGAPAGSRSLTCQNVTMAEFSDRLQNLAPALSWPVTDATEIEGGWDFTLTFSQFNPVTMNGAGRGGGASSTVPTASDPTGAYTIFDAIQKQLGLALKTQKRSMSVIVIDHMDEKPTDN